MASTIISAAIACFFLFKEILLYQESYSACYYYICYDALDIHYFKNWYAISATT